MQFSMYSIYARITCEKKDQKQMLLRKTYLVNVISKVCIVYFSLHLVERPDAKGLSA